ncbi:MAG: ABC transporter ATP-binding protein [Methanoregulaceae archaeon]
MLRLENIGITLGSFSLHDISLEIRDGEYFIILGPTGAGKTILLEMVAGIHSPDTGRIFLGDREITMLEPRERGVGVVYQDYMLFPHLTVAGNIGFGLRQRGEKPDVIRKAVDEMAGLLSIQDLLSRYPGTLSGGEQQRAALARALILKPRVILLDEPLSALDARMRDRMRTELARIHTVTGTTLVHITHHFEDVFTLADRIAIMREGEIVQTGTPSEVFQRPCDMFVAQFLGIGNLLHGVSRVEGDLARIAVHDGPEIVASSRISGEVVATLHAEDVILSRAPFPSSARNCLRGTISEIVSMGTTVRVSADAGVPLTAILTRQSVEDLGVIPGGEVFLTFKASAVHVIPVGEK